MKKWLKTVIPVLVFAFILLFSGIQTQVGTTDPSVTEAGTTATEKVEDTTVSKLETKADTIAGNTTGVNTGASAPVMLLAVLTVVAFATVFATAVSKKHA